MSVQVPDPEVTQPDSAYTLSVSATITETFIPPIALLAPSLTVTVAVPLVP